MSTKTIVFSALLYWITATVVAQADSAGTISVEPMDVGVVVSGAALYTWAGQKAKKIANAAEELLWDGAQKEMDEVRKLSGKFYLNSAPAEWMRANRNQTYMNIMMSDMPVADRELRLAREALLIGNHLGLTEDELKGLFKSYRKFSQKTLGYRALQSISPLVTLKYFWDRASNLQKEARSLDDGTGHLAPLAPRSLSAE